MIRTHRAVTYVYSVIIIQSSAWPCRSNMKRSHKRLSFHVIFMYIQLASFKYIILQSVVEIGI